jgi:uncharacterized protein
MTGQGSKAQTSVTTAASAASPRKMLDEAAFVAFLQRRRPQPPAFTMDATDGYLTALIVGPRFIDPRKWIPSFVGDSALMASEEAIEARALQTLVAAYNAISTSLAETPDSWRPRLAPQGDGTFDPFFWWTGFLTGTDFAPKLWRPVLHGHPETGDIIAPIRNMSEAGAILDASGLANVAKAVVAIRAHFMPRRAKSRT